MGASVGPMWLCGTDSSDEQFALLSQPNEGNPNPLDSRKRILSRKRGFSRRKHIDAPGNCSPPVRAAAKPGNCSPPVRAAARNLEAEPHPENVVFVIEKTSFWECFDHLKGGVRDTRFLEPIYQ